MLVIALLILGPKRLPAAGRSLGRGIKEFKEAITGRTDTQPDLPAGRDSGEPRTPSSRSAHGLSRQRESPSRHTPGTSPIRPRVRCGHPARRSRACPKQARTAGTNRRPNAMP